MKKIIFILLILMLNFFAPLSEAKDNTVTAKANEYCNNGDKILNYYEKLKDKSNPDKYLSSAKYYYYQASRIDMSNQNAFIGRARIALLENHTKDAKNNLMMALNFNERNPKVNFYLGETFFKDGEYTQAIFYYNKAYTLGYKYDYRTNLMLGISYEKMDDVNSAKYHFKNAIKIKPSEVEPQARLQGIDAINTNYDSYESDESES